MEPGLADDLRSHPGSESAERCNRDLHPRGPRRRHRDLHQRDIGVDVVLTASDAVVIEVNPRLTTAYLGARRAIDENIAELVLAACVGSLPPPPTVRRGVRFEPDGCCSVIDGLTVSQH